MTVGLTIPGVQTVHPTEDWVDPCYPVTGPAQHIENIYQPLIHYTAAINLPDGDLGEHDYQIAPFLRNTNKDYWTNRKGSGITTCGTFKPGYAIGYLFAVDWLGGVWELRGFKYFPAATADHNSYTFPILFLTDLNAPASELMMESARAVWREARRRSGRADFRNRPKGHREMCNGCTTCPGDILMQQRDLGLMDLDHEGDDDMTPLAKPERAYDSRPSEQAGVNPALREANKNVPLTQLEGGKARGIVIGFTSQAYVNITVIGSTPGWVEIMGTDGVPTTSLCNIDPDGVTSGGGPILTPEGKVYVYASAPCDIVVDVRARK